MASKKVEWLVAGLGNPGEKYSGSRHNIGWMAATRLADKFKKPVMQLYPGYMHAAMRIKGKLVLSILPLTFMNRSGEAVLSAMKFFEVSPENLIVIVDEYNFDLGRIHVRKGGGDGGHNGVASIIEKINSTDFYRIRCGIGHDFGPGEMSDYVLAHFKEDEKPIRDQMAKNAADAVAAMIHMSPGRAMPEINSGKLFDNNEEKSQKNENLENNN